MGRVVVVAMRRIIAEALATNPRLGAIKVKLDDIFAGDVTVAPLAGSLITATRINCSALACDGWTPHQRAVEICVTQCLSYTSGRAQARDGGGMTSAWVMAAKTQQDAANHCHSRASCQRELERCQWVATP